MFTLLRRTSSPRLPRHIEAFASTHFSSPDEMDVLVVLMDTPDRWWDTSMVGRHLGIDLNRARAALDRLVARNLLDIRLTDDVRYRFLPGTADLAQLALAFARHYRRHRDWLLSIVSGSEPARASNSSR